MRLKYVLSVCGEGVHGEGDVCMVKGSVHGEGVCGGGVNVVTLLLQKICADPEAHQRVRRSYEMMLDFYGMKLKEPKTGLWVQCSKRYHTY